MDNLLYIDEMSGFQQVFIILRNRPIQGSKGNTDRLGTRQGQPVYYQWVACGLLTAPQPSFLALDHSRTGGIFQQEI
tara:strand:- start:225 stop:455 length:231 start_codon:yes stop_codon:yes gene_type:complete